MEEVTALHRAHAFPPPQPPCAPVLTPAPPPVAAPAANWHPDTLPGGRGTSNPTAYSSERFTNRPSKPGPEPCPDPLSHTDAATPKAGHLPDGRRGGAATFSAKVETQAPEGVAAAAAATGRRRSSACAAADAAQRPGNAAAEAAIGVPAMLPSAERREAVRKLLQVGSNHTGGSRP